MSMRSLIIIAAWVVCFALFCAAGFQRRELAKLNSDRDLQLTEAAGKEIVTDTEGPPASDEQAIRQLLQLRNQVSQLRRERDELQSERQEYERLQQQLSARG